VKKAVFVGSRMGCASSELIKEKRLSSRVDGGGREEEGSLTGTQ